MLASLFNQDKLDRVFRSVCRLAGLNALWLLGCIIGLGVFGVFPATRALFRLLAERSPVQPMPALAGEFFQLYRRLFWQANLAGLLWLAALLLLVMNARVIDAAAGAVPLPMVSAYLLLVVVFSLFSLVALPVSADATERSLLDFIKFTLCFVLGRLPTALASLLSASAVLWLCLAVPAFFLFFGASTLAWILTALYRQSLARLAGQLKTVSEYHG